MNDSCHRRRYRLLSDRRRLGFELERLWSTLERHPAWFTVAPERREALEALLDTPACAPTEPAERLEADVRAATRSLVELARAWHALERASAPR